jgi:hypothetical protein
LLWPCWKRLLHCCGVGSELVPWIHILIPLHLGFAAGSVLDCPSNLGSSLFLGWEVQLVLCEITSVGSQQVLSTSFLL